ncbi:signal transduction histidine kinase [Nocardiopsis arvandica]|uniref:histidine kinase n=1 Tax=Nocardiopsis sinuspersici TaxID=501010 RepID=A0A7Y9X951_9ACTN|nr:histidine kinase [Nocardiopsis sinuspersici]NYH50500.1 signal transduction histidine kinase [Nocardiopsis sinuspersici]
MRSWVNDRGGAAGALWDRNREWWWHRRLGIADWLYAVLPLPFSGLMQLSAAAGAEGLGLLGGVFAAFVGSLIAMNPLLALPLGMILYVIPVLWAGLTVLLRRSHPRWLLVTAFVLLLFFANFVPAAIALYSYAVYFDNRRLLVGWFALYGLAMILAYEANPFGQIFMIGMFLVVPMTFGLWVGTRRQLIDRLHERAERLEREQHMMAEQAITAERTRIAREMHDVVAHRVSLMVLHAGGLEVSTDDPRTVEAAGLIRTTGREALSELRGILGVLRDDTAAAPTAPQPVLADLDRLVGEWRAAGMRIIREDSGQGPPLPAGVQRTAYRIVQEGLTNAAKHAPGAAVALRLHRSAHRLEVEVANEPVPAPAAPMPRSGFGLTGLRERVVLAGGSLSAGACPDGGWRMRAILRTDNPPGTEEVSHGDPHAPGR